MTAPGAPQTYVERIAPSVVGVTYWFDPPRQPPVQSVTVRLTGRRLDVPGNRGPRDCFLHDETLAGIVGGSGPIAITMKIRDLNPGSWTVSARTLPNNDIERRHTARIGRAKSPVVPVYRAEWSWRRWRVAAAPSMPVGTCLAPFVRQPAVIIGSWLAFVVVGIALALVTQQVVIAVDGLRLSHVLTVSILALLSGVLGAKAWFMVIHREEQRREGWCIQGFVTAIAAVAPMLLAVLRVPIGAFLDAIAPGLMIGLAVGRLGCFLTGCCAGRPTGRRWGVWSSNRTVGARRIPTQLMESLLALGAGLTILVIVLTSGVHHGAWFIAAVAAYTLIRQAILRLREERRQSRLGSPLLATT